MNTILTDGEVRVAINSTAYNFKAEDIARAVEAAVLEKLAQQEPVAWILRSGKARWVELDDPAAASALPKGTTSIPLYAHPAPQQADRQRVPDEFDYKHPKAQALIGADARHRIIIDLVWRILEDPRREFTASDMEYWDTLHDKVQEVALAAAPEAPAQANAVDERDRKDAERYRFIRNADRSDPHLPYQALMAYACESFDEAIDDAMEEEARAAREPKVQLHKGD